MRRFLTSILNTLPDRANPLVLGNHVVNGREREHVAFLLDRMGDPVLFLELLEELGTGFLDVRLTFEIEDVINSRSKDILIC